MKYSRDLLNNAQLKDLMELYRSWVHEPSTSGKWEDFMDHVRNPKNAQEKETGFPQWRAIRFINKTYGTRWVRQDNGRFSVPERNDFFSSPESYMLSCGLYTLVEVERLQDGAFFKLGQVVEIKDHDKKYRITDIHQSQFNPGVYFNTVSLDGKNEYIGCPIDLLTGVEKLFTTDDGVDIYDGDTYWENTFRDQLTNPKGYLERTAVVDGDEDYNSEFRTEEDKRFSTYEAVVEYCVNNRHNFSLNDLKKVYADHNLNIHKRLLESIVDLIKSRI